LQAGDVSKVAPMDKRSLLLVAVFAIMFLHERPTMQKGVGILLAGAGVLILGLKR
jgi:bacterial/archaeal transporter family protein